ncbi:MAG: redoxin domain-containing protein [Acidimicrobiia bacterium]
MRTSRVFRIAAVVLAAVGSVAVVSSRRVTPESIGRSSGAFGDGSASAGASTLPVLADAAPAVQTDEWLNTAPLGVDDLRGKVVLYDFWTFGCINCKHTLPWVKAWAERYRTDGLIVLSIHTPEFDYEADPANVARFVADNAITYPVALDPQRLIWKQFDNRYWPAFYLHDRDGRRRYVRFGEGEYASTENALRALLGVDPTSPRATVA